MNEIKAEGLAVPKDTEMTTLSITAPVEHLFSSDIRVSDLRKALSERPKTTSEQVASNQGRIKGRVPHPFDYSAAQKLLEACHIHEVCIMTKRDAIVGLGFETEEEANARAKKKELEQAAHAAAIAGDPNKKPPPAGGDAPVKKELPLPKPAPSDAPPKGDPAAEDPMAAPKPRSVVEEKLDPLCEDGFHSMMNQIAEDYVTHGIGYMEVVRGMSGSILGLWHMPTWKVFKFNEDEKPFFHYEVDDLVEGGLSKLIYAKWNEVDRVTALLQNPQQKITELIRFVMPSARQVDYSMPDYFGCVPWLELAQKVMQYDFDYFNNRAVPDLLVMLTGRKVAPDELKLFAESLKATIGEKNRHRSLVANFSAPDLVATVERLNADNRERFGDLWSAIQLAVVSSHRIPPLLAGVTLPGKMAAANELPNALIAFQTLYVDQQQKVFERVLGATLGSDEAGLGLKPTDFRLKKITDAYDMGQVDTMSRMRETTTEAQLKGRDLANGLKE
jgi:hypothetical protein